jgi:hypothetical protein
MSNDVMCLFSTLSKRFVRGFGLPALLLFLAACTSSPRIPFEKDKEVLGVWLWYVSLDSAQQYKYLDFAEKNGINEIYYCNDLKDKTNIGSFVARAQKRGIKVYLLVDDYKFIWDHALFARTMERFIAYQNKAPENQKFAGLHLDIEPQIHPRYDENALAFLQDYMDFVVWACSTYSPAGTFDFDIAYWFDNEVTYRGEKTQLYKALITEADRVFVMSYKDTAERMYDTAKEEIAFAKSLNKQIVLGAETGEIKDEPEISYYGKGSAYMHEQLHKLAALIDYDNYGLSIHHMASWYNQGP